MKATFNRVIFAVLLAATFLVPIFFVPVSFIPLQFGTSLLFAIAVIVSVLIYIVAILASGSLELPQPSLIPVGFLAIVPIVYTLAGIAHGFSRMAFFGYTFDQSTVGFIVLGFVYVFLVSLIFKTKSRVFYSYFAFVISSIILSLFIIIRLAFGEGVLSFGQFGQLTSTMLGNWNNVGIFFGLTALLSLLTYELVEVSRFMKVLLSLALLLSLFFLALVNFTMIWGILAICSFLFILYGIFSNRFKNISWYAVLVLLVSLVFVIWPTIGGFFADTFHVTNIEVRPSLSLTLDIAKSTLESQPLFGSGPNTFVTQWLTFKPDSIISTIFWNTDFTNGIGLIPTFAVTTGLIGILSWVLFFIFYIYLGFKSIFAQVADKFTKYLIISSFFVSLYLWIMTFVYVPSTPIFILTFFFTGLFLASVYIAELIPVSVKTLSTSARGGFLAGLTLASLFVASSALAYGLSQNSRSLWYFQKSSYALNSQNDLNASEDYMTQAIAAVPLDVYYRALSQIEIYKLNAILSQDPKKVRVEDAQKAFADTLSAAIKAGIAATNADQKNYLNWIALGQVYQTAAVPELSVNGAYESAQLAYNEALKRNPKSPGILVLFAQLAQTHKDFATARQYVTQAIMEKKDYLDAYFLLSQIEVASGNIKGAIDSVSSASVIDPTNPAIFFQLGLLKYNIQDFDGAIVAFQKATSLTPNYANAKYFLGLSYEAVGEHNKAVEEFTALRQTNPDSTEVAMILTNLQAGKPIFANAKTTKPEKSKSLPIKEVAQ